MAEYKSEYYNGEMFARAVASFHHNALAARWVIAIDRRVEGRGCIVLGSDMRVRTELKPLYTYPDLTVVCGRPQFDDSGELDVLTNPKLIVEILSTTTEAHDRGFKFQKYKTIESLEEYLLVDQRQPRVECFHRAPGTDWAEYADYQGLDATVRFKSLGIEIPLAEIYRDIEFLEDESSL